MLRHALRAVAPAILLVAGPATAQDTPLVEFLGQRFYVTLGGMPGSQGVGFDWVNREILSVDLTDECGTAISDGGGDAGIAFDPVTEAFWTIGLNREVTSLAGGTPQTVFTIPETFDVPGAGLDTLENPQGLALDGTHVYVLDSGPNLATRESNAWFKFTRDGTPVSSSRLTDFTAELIPHENVDAAVVVDGITWIPPHAPFGGGLFLVAVEHSGIQVIDEDGFFVDRLLWPDEGLVYGESVPFAFAGLAIDPLHGDLYLVENAGQLMHVWIRTDPAEDPSVVYGVAQRRVLLPDVRCARPLPIGGNGPDLFFSLTYREVDGKLWTSDFGTGDVFTVDPLSGKKTNVGNLGFVNNWGMAWDPGRDVIYCFREFDASLHVLDPATVQTTPLPESPGFVRELAFNPEDDSVYGVGSVSGEATLIRIDRDTGAPTLVGPTVNAAGLCWDPVVEGLIGFAQGEATLYAIDPATGFAFVLAQLPSNAGWEGLATVPLASGLTASPSIGPTDRVALRAFPNPTSAGSRVAFELARAGRVDARVLDVTGRVVRNLAAGRRLPAGRVTLEWDGRGHDGATLPAGVYFVEVRRGDARDVAKVTVVR